MAATETRAQESTPDGRLPEGFEGPRACGPYDLAPMLDLINLVFRTQPASGAPRAPNMGWDYTHVYNPENLDNVRIVCHQGRPVSSVGIYPTTVRTPRGTIGVGGISAVATHPDYRRRGLNTLTMRDAQARMRELGLHAGLLGTGITNYYRKLGWERGGRQRTFTLDRRNVTLLPADDDLDVTQEWQPHLDHLCTLHDAGRVGAARPPATFALLAARKASRIFIAHRRGTVVAYAALSGTAVREYGGDPADVAALLRRLFETVETLPARSTERIGTQQGQFELTVLTPDDAAGNPTGLPARLLDLGIPTALGYMGMLQIVDPPGLFAALGIDVAVEPREAGWRLRHAGRTLDLTVGELVKLVFGPERRPDFAPDVFPVPFYQWPMDRV